MTKIRFLAKSMTFLALLFLTFKWGRTEAQNFTKVSTASLPALTQSRAQWADFNNDGLLDLFISGVDDTGAFHTSVYTSNGDDTFDVIDLEGQTDIAVDFADYNLDGYIDIIIAGSNASGVKKTTIYKNNGGTAFIAQEFGFTGLSGGGILWRDLDQDGDPDVLVTGVNSTGSAQTLVYRYSTGAYQLQSSDLPIVSNGQLKALDLDNDDRTEIVLTGLNESGVAITHIYTMDSNLNPVLYSNTTEGTAFNSISLGDYNEDGYADLVIAGLSGSSLTKKSLLLRNNQANGFLSVSVGFQPVSSASADIGDLDNDGLSDVVITGIDESSIKYLKYYRNTSSHSFSDSAHVMENIYNGDVSFGDYDNDGDLDIFQIGNSDINFQGNIYRSDATAAGTNAAPAPPANLISVVTEDSVYLTWDASTDDLTAPASLTYNLYLSEAAGGDTLFVSPLSNITSGHLTLPQHGNAGWKNFKSFNKLPEGKYYWSVQAIDNSYKASSFAPEQSFAVCYPIDLGPDTTICYGDYLSVEIGDATDVVNWYSKTNGLIQANSNVFTYQILDNDTIIAELTRPYGCTAYDTLVVKVSALPEADLGSNTAICFGQEFTLTVPDSYDSVNWYSSGVLLLANAHNYTFTVEQKDTIVAEIFNVYQCKSKDTIIVDVLPLPVFSAGSDTAICYQQDVLLVPDGAWQTVNWYSVQRGLLATDTGRYQLQVLEKDTVVAEVSDGNGCINYDSLIVDVLSLPEADLGADTAICYNEGVLLALPADANTVNWYTMNSQLLAAGTHSYFKEVTRKDTVVVEVIDANSCVSYDSITVDVLPLPVFDTGSDTAVCYGQDILLQAGHGFMAVNWYSAAGDSLLLGNSWFYNYPVQTTDTLITEVYSMAGCVNYDTIAIAMNPLPDYTLGEDISICYGDSIRLVVEGSWSEVNWYTSGDLMLGQNKADYAFKAEENITIWSEVFTSAGCVAYDTISVNVLNLPQFDLGAGQSYCFGDSVLIDPGDVGSAYLWVNSTGNEVSSERSHTFMAETSETFYLTVTSQDQCRFTDSVSITVNALPVFEIEGPAEICENDTAALTITSGWQTLVWHDDLDTLFTGTDNISLPLSSSKKIFAILADANSCRSEDSIEVIVNKRPQALAGKDSLLCFGEQVILGGTYEDVTNLAFAWTPSETLDNPAIANPLATPGEPLTYILTVTTAKGCSSVDSVYIEVNPQITVDAGENVAICIGDTITLGGNPSASGSRFGYDYQWLPSSTLNGSSLANPRAFPRETTTYNLLVVSGKCSVEYDSVTVIVNPLPVIEVVSDKSIGGGESVALSASGGVAYAWTPGQSLDDPASQTPMASPSTTTTYKVVVTDENGCSETGEVDVLVQNTIFIPTLFTPNGDGNNDAFKLYGSGVAQIELSVYDQSGRRVYHTKDRQEAFETGWDGTWNGSGLKNDVYTWTIDGEYYNGEKVRFEGKNSGFVKMVK